MKNLVFVIAFIILSVEVCSAQQWNAQFINTGGSTIYDLASNSSPQWFAQDPSNPDNLHAVLLYSPLGDPTGYPGRRTRYYFSSDGGNTWNFIGNVNERKSGFPSILVASDGAAAICNYGTTSSNTSTRVLLHIDAYPGLGSFTLYDAPNSSYFFGKFCLTSDITLSTKFLIMAQGMTSDSTMKITGPSPWSSWSSFANTSPEAYCAAKGADGRIGIVYIQNNFSVNDYKSIYFIETTNNGVSFSAPLKIFLANFSTDSLAAFRGLNIAYKGNTPCVVFETVKQDPVSASYFMKAPAKIRFWNPQLPGSDPNKSISIADKSNVPIPSEDSIKTGVNDQLGSLSRPVVGISSDTNSVFVVFQAFTNKWGGTPPDTTNFKALYITKATNNFNFSIPYKFTPDTPLKDWSYPSISLTNNKSTSLNVNICSLRDSIPGTYVNANGNGQSLAELYYIKLSTAHTIGIGSNANEIFKYSLEQNYPNPFNSMTAIKFQLAEAGFVKLTVFDILGREVAVLLNDIVQQGNHSVKFDSKNLTSGIYFYRLSTDKFSDTKKFILLK